MSAFPRKRRTSSCPLWAKSGHSAFDRSPAVDEGVFNATPESFWTEKVGRLQAATSLIFLK
jgi:hypothetical protein